MVVVRFLLVGGQSVRYKARATLDRLGEGRLIFSWKKASNLAASFGRGLVLGFLASLVVFTLALWIAFDQTGLAVATTAEMAGAGMAVFLALQLDEFVEDKRAKRRDKERLKKLEKVRLSLIEDVVFNVGSAAWVISQLRENRVINDSNLETASWEIKGRAYMELEPAWEEAEKFGGFYELVRRTIRMCDIQLSYDSRLRTGPIAQAFSWKAIEESSKSIQDNIKLTAEAVITRGEDLAGQFGTPEHKNQLLQGKQKWAADQSV